MNAIQLAQSGYKTSRAPIRTDRSTEYDVFARITHDIKMATAQGKPDYAALVKALYDNRKLWTILATDVADNTNALPKQLRAQIFYLAKFTEAHSRKVLDGTATADALIDINTSIMRGLRNSGGTVS